MRMAFGQERKLFFELSLRPFASSGFIRVQSVALLHQSSITTQQFRVLPGDLRSKPVRGRETRAHRRATRAHRRATDQSAGAA